MKVKTLLPPPVETKTKSLTELRKEFVASRADIRSFLKQPDLPFHSHYGRSPYGRTDCYQLFLVIAGHGMRHRHQILENIDFFYSVK